MPPFIPSSIRRDINPSHLSQFMSLFARLIVLSVVPQPLLCCLFPLSNTSLVELVLYEGFCSRENATRAMPISGSGNQEPPPISRASRDAPVPDLPKETGLDGQEVG
jgi:hypothetical protein